MGFQILSALIEITILPITGMIYMMLMFPIRYSPLKSLILQFPIYITAVFLVRR